VVTYGSNTNTSTVVREIMTVSGEPDKPLRNFLETDAPYMVPANLHESLPEIRALCHSDGSLDSSICSGYGWREMGCQ
jgi:TatD DNase family protein